MVAYLTTSDYSKGFNQIIDFLNESYIKYALTVNPNIYVSCIKQFWNTVAIKQVNDVTRLQALVDKKRVVVTKAAIRECMSAKRTSWNEFSSSMASAIICLSTVRKGFSGVDIPLFEGMLVAQEIEEEGDADKHVKDVTAGDDTHGDDTAAHGEVPTVTQELSIPSPTPPISPPQPPQDLPSTSQVQQTLPQSPQRVDTFDDTVMDDEANQGRMIAEMDKDDDVVLMDDKKEDKKVEEAKEDETEPAEVQEVVDVVTTAKLITEVATTASEIVTAASAIIPTVEPQVLAATLSAAPARVVAASTIDHVKLKAKEDPTVKRYQAMKRKPQTEAQARKNRMMYLKNVASFKLDYFKGMSYDDIRLIFKAKFNSNVDFLLKTKEQMEEEENRALRMINETLAEKAAKRRKLNEEVEDLKRHLEIMPDEDDDVHTEATPLERKVPVVDYEIIELNNKPYYKIIRADGTHQLYINFLTLLKNFNREDLKAL
nr:hypothetical protein [Tanacetum cinerariifolium]